MNRPTIKVQVPGGYDCLASADGRVFERRNFRGRQRLLEVAQKPSTGGYRYVSIKRLNGHRCTRYVHWIIAETFLGPRPPRNVARHLDDVPANNSIKNLKWGTTRDNMLDAVRNGRRQPLKLTADTAAYLKGQFRLGVSRKWLADLYGISETHVYIVGTGRSWADVPPEDTYFYDGPLDHRRPPNMRIGRPRRWARRRRRERS